MIDIEEKEEPSSLFNQLKNTQDDLEKIQEDLHKDNEALMLSWPRLDRLEVNKGLFNQNLPKEIEKNIISFLDFSEFEQLIGVSLNWYFTFIGLVLPKKCDSLFKIIDSNKRDDTLKINPESILYKKEVEIFDTFFFAVSPLQVAAWSQDTKVLSMLLKCLPSGLISLALKQINQLNSDGLIYYSKNAKGLVRSQSSCYVDFVGAMRQYHEKPEVVPTFYKKLPFYFKQEFCGSPRADVRVDYSLRDFNDPGINGLIIRTAYYCNINMLTSWRKFKEARNPFIKLDAFNSLLVRGVFAQFSRGDGVRKTHAAAVSNPSNGEIRRTIRFIENFSARQQRSMDSIIGKFAEQSEDEQKSLAFS